jgi:hypothetical protein
VVLYRPREETAFWQIVSPDSVEETSKRWKLLVPWQNQLDAASAEALAKHAEGDPLGLLMRRCGRSRIVQ